MQEGEEFLAWPMSIPSAIDGLLQKINSCETLEVDKFKGARNPHILLLSEFAPRNNFKNAFSSQFTVLDTVTLTQNKRVPLYPIDPLRFNYQFFWSIFPHIRSENFPYIFSEQQILPFIA